uniref:Uncharacterized protein n=1 Tax=Glossina pallidipes TaxID=7398 RepID=A0A1B0ACD5_GLOPL
MLSSSSVRCCLSPQFLAGRVTREELIKFSHQCRDLLDEAKDFHLMPERRRLLESFRKVFQFSKTRQRGEFTSGQVYAGGGLASNGESVSTVEIYDPYEKSRRMGEQMSMMKLAYNFYTQVDLTCMLL